MTGGTSWHMNTNWLDGEPCVNQWRGITCCPDTHPQLAAGACIAHTGERHALSDPADTVPNGCSSGSVTGTSADAARCVVKSIDLAENNLVGSLNESMSALTSLQYLVVSGNQLYGELPAALSELPSIRRVQVYPNLGVAMNASH